MNLSQKIKQLRYRAGLTQEQLAGTLGVSAQSVSKWENAVAMPDITLLPLLAEVFGVSIDDLFDLTVEQKLRRIENRIEMEGEFESDVFREYEEFLMHQLSEYSDTVRILSLLAHLYHHRMEADSVRVKKYAREAIRMRPEQKNCQWLLQMAEGQYPWDWNIFNHASAIDFYKEVIDGDRVEPKTPLPYYYLIDHLIADHRTEEAKQYLSTFQTLPAHKPCMVPIYSAHIALAEFDEEKADCIIQNALAQYADNSDFLFETAQYYARKCDYDTAITFYERAWNCDKHIPRYTDALESIALIYEIQGKTECAVKTYDRLLEHLKTEWNFSAEDKPVADMEQKKNRLLRRL